MRISSLIALMAIVSYLVVGQLVYFAGINSALLIPSAISILLWVIVIGKFKNSVVLNSRKIKLPLVFPILLFIFFVVLSAIINHVAVIALIASYKNMLLLSVYFAISLCFVAVEKIESIIKWLFPITFAQIPFILYQHFIIAPRRVSAARGNTAEASWDAVVGSFGGDPLGGGASGSMAFTIVSACMLAFALWKRRLITGQKLAGVFIATGICLAFAEVKYVTILFPVGMLILSLPLLIKKPVVALFSMFMISIAMVGLLYLYGTVHYEAAGVAQKDSFEDVLDAAFGYSTDNDLISDTGEMSRTGAYTFWWNKGFLPDVVHGFFGYGPGASRSQSTFAVGEIASRYSFAIDRSLGVVLLWDIGLLGFMSYVFIMISSVILAYKTALHTLNPTRKAILEATSAMLAMLILMVPYSREILEVPALTFMMMMLLGYTAQANVLRQFSK